MNIGNIFDLNLLELLQGSARFSVVFLLLFIPAAIQDYKYNEISDIICIPIGFFLFIHSLIYSNNILAVNIVLLCIIFTFGPKEFEYFGQADILLIAHLFTSYTFTGVGLVLIILACVSWLVSLLIYLVYERIKHNYKWIPFKGMCVPALPSYVLSLFIMVPLRFILTNYLFFSGW